MRPVSPRALVGEVVARVDSLVAGAAARGAAVRLGVDGSDPHDTEALADAVATDLADRGRAVARVRAADFMARRSVRLEYGTTDVDAAYERWVDWAALAREVLDPLADPAAMTWLPRLWDAALDRPARESVRVAPPGTVAVVDGPFLLRWELSGGFDQAVHLGLSATTLARRFAAPDPRAGAWARYLDECDPAARADLVVRYDHSARPAVLAARTL